MELDDHWNTLGRYFASPEEMNTLENMFGDITKGYNLYIIPIGISKLSVTKIEVTDGDTYIHEGKQYTERKYLFHIKYLGGTKNVKYLIIKELFVIDLRNKKKLIRLNYFLKNAFKHKIIKRDNIEDYDEQILFWKKKEFTWMVGRIQDLYYTDEGCSITLNNFLSFNNDILCSYIPLDEVQLSILERFRIEKEKQIIRNLKMLE